MFLASLWVDLHWFDVKVSSPVRVPWEFLTRNIRRIQTAVVGKETCSMWLWNAGTQCLVFRLLQYITIYPSHQTQKCTSFHKRAAVFQQELFERIVPSLLKQGPGPFK